MTISLRILAVVVALAVAVPAAGQRPASPFSQFVPAGDLVFLSGQVAIDPASNKLDSATSIEAQTELAWYNVQSVLKSAGLGLKDVVQVTVYLTDMSDFMRMNAAYVKSLGTLRPARTAVGVHALPLGARIEIAVIAHRGR